ncbi:MAG: HD domain-containing protein [Acetatifactor sp.]|nr:HD domain-containing protein [Acetatifactor sp.]
MRNRFDWLRRLDEYIGLYFGSGRMILIFFLLSVGFLYMHGLFPEISNHYTWENVGLIVENPTSVARTSDDRFIMNDSDRKLIIMDDKGNLVRTIQCGQYCYFSDLITDSNGKFYTILSQMDENESTLLTQTVVEYDTTGKKISELYAIDYTLQTANQENCYRKVLLGYNGNSTLYVIQYGEKHTVVMEINLDTRQVQKIGDVESATTFLYSHLNYVGNNQYIYVKFTGEIGVGTFGGNQTILQEHAVSMDDLDEVRASFCFEQGGIYYVRDNWAKRLYYLNADDSLGLQPWNLTADGRTLREKATYLGMQNGWLCGISDKQMWILEDDTVRLLPSYVRANYLYVFWGLLKNVLITIAFPMGIILLVIDFLLMLYQLMLHGRTLFWKIFLYSAFICIVSLCGVLGIYRRERTMYQQDIMRQSQSLLRIAKNNIDPAIFELAKKGDFFETSEYEETRQILVDSFGEYKNGSEEAIVLMVPLQGNNHASDIASNRGKSDLSHVQSYVVGLAISDISYEQQEDVIYYDEHVIASTGFYDESGQLIGYCCLYEPFYQIRNRFMAMWTNAITYALILMLFAGTYLFSWMFTRRFNRLHVAINEIAEGDMQYRLREDYEDELGDISKAVNQMTMRIGTLMEENEQKNEEIRQSQQEVMISLASLTEAKSGETGNHIRRVGEYVRILAQDFGFENQELEYISTAAILHDVGKLMVPQDILAKPGKLTAEEFEIMKHHTIDGEVLLRNAPGKIMEYARHIALEHHEKWNGKGYAGLRGEEISIEARITALADAFDAVVSQRCYKEAKTVEEAYEIIISERGEHFDPAVVDAFVRHFEEMKEIERIYRDATSNIA